MNNVADIWFKGRYVDKMPMYSRPGKIICILKENSVQSTNMVSRGVVPPHQIWTPPLKIAPAYMTLKPPPSPPLCLSKSHKKENYDKVPCSSFQPTFLPVGKNLCQAIHLL